MKIHISQTDPYILVLTETWLKQSIHDPVSLHNYNLCRADRVGGGGGVAVDQKSLTEVDVDIGQGPIQCDMVKHLSYLHIPKYPPIKRQFQ